MSPKTRKHLTIFVIVTAVVGLILTAANWFLLGELRTSVLSLSGLGFTALMVDHLLRES